MHTPGCVSLIIFCSIAALVDGASKYTKHDGQKGDKFKFNSAEKLYIYKFIILPYPSKS